MYISSVDFGCFSTKYGDCEALEEREEQVTFTLFCVCIFLMSLLTLETLLNLIDNIITLFESCARHESGLKQMKGIQTLFWGGVVAAVLLIGGLLTIYFFQFHGPLADNSSQWADFSSFVGNLSMVFLTALNTIVVYKLTYTIARREEIEHKFEVQRELNKSFTSSVYSVFVSIDDDNGACGLADNKLAFAWDNFRLLQTFENINPNGYKNNL